MTKKISISFTLRRQEIVVMSTTIEALPSTGIDIFNWIFGETYSKSFQNKMYKIIHIHIFQAGLTSR